MILKTTVLLSWAVTASFGAPAKLPLHSGPQPDPNPSNSFEIPLPDIPSGLYELPEAGSSPPRHTIPGQDALIIFPEPSQSVSHFQPLENEFPTEEDPFPGPDSDAVEVRKPISTAHLENKTGVEEAGPPVLMPRGVAVEAELPPEVTNVVPDVDLQAEMLPNPKVDMPPMPYAFDFDVSDNIGGVYFSRQEEQKEEGPLTGSYSYLRPDGIYMTVIYEADENGYRARVIESKALPEHLQSESTGTASARVQLPQSSRIAWTTTENNLEESRPKSMSDDSNGHQGDSVFSRQQTEKQESIAWPDAGPKHKDTQSEVFAKESMEPLDSPQQKETHNIQKDITAISLASTHSEEKAESLVPSGGHSDFPNILQKHPQPPVFHQDQEQQIAYEEDKQNSEILQDQNTNSEFNLSTGDNEKQHPDDDALEVQDQSASTNFQENLTPFVTASTGFGESPASKDSVQNGLDKKGIFSADPVQLTGSKPSNPTVVSLPEDQQTFQQGPVQHKFSEEIQSSQDEETAITVEKSNPTSLSVPAVQEENHLNIEDDAKHDRPSPLNDQLPPHTVILEKELVEKRLQTNTKTDDQTNQLVDEDVEPQPSNTVSASKVFTEEPSKPADTAVQDEASAKLTPAEVDDADAAAVSVSVDTHFDPAKSPVHLHVSEHLPHTDVQENAQLPVIHPHYTAAICEECINDEHNTGIDDGQGQSATQSLTQDSQQQNSHLDTKQQRDFPEVNNVHENGEYLISDDIYTTESVITNDESLSGITDNKGNTPLEPNVSESKDLSNQFPLKELHSESTDEENKHLPIASNQEQNRDNSDLIIQYFPNNPFFQKKESSDQVQSINYESPTASIQPNNRHALGTTNLQAVHTVLPVLPHINPQNEETFIQSAAIHNAGSHPVPQFQDIQVNKPPNNQVIPGTGVNDNQNTNAVHTTVNMPAVPENIFTEDTDSYDYYQQKVAVHANSNPDDSARPLLGADSEDTFQGLPVQSYDNFYTEQTWGHNTHPDSIKAEATVQPQSELRQMSQSTKTDELTLDSSFSEDSKK